VIERNRRHEETRTPDLHRVNDLQGRGDCQSTRNSYKTYIFVGWAVGWNCSTNPRSRRARAIQKASSRIAARRGDQADAQKHVAAAKAILDKGTIPEQAPFFPSFDGESPYPR
jgi:hypothetical protein